MKKEYKVSYYFDGSGTVIIKAKDEEEAKDKFFSGEFKNEDEWGETYNIDKVEEV